MESVPSYKLDLLRGRSPFLTAIYSTFQDIAADLILKMGCFLSIQVYYSG